MHGRPFQITQSLQVAGGKFLQQTQWDFPSAWWAWSSSASSLLLLLVVTISRNIPESGLTGRSGEPSVTPGKTQGDFGPQELGLMCVKLTHSINKQSAYVRA